MPENIVRIVKEHAGGARSDVTELAVGPDFDVKVERDKNTGRNTVVIKSAGPEADDPVLLKTHEHVRKAPSSDPELAKVQLESEGGVHLANPGAGGKVDESAPGAGTAAMPTGPDGVPSPDQTVEQGGEAGKAEETPAAATETPDVGSGPMADRTVPQLRAVAKRDGVDLQGATTKDDILKALGK